MEAQLKEEREAKEAQIVSMAQMDEDQRKLTKEIKGLREDLDIVAKDKAKAMRAKAKVESEVEDMMVQLNSQQTELTAMCNKQRQHEKALAEERARVQTATDEKDALQSQVSPIKSIVRHAL